MNIASAKEKFPGLLVKTLLAFSLLLSAIYWYAPVLYVRLENKISDFTIDLFSGKEADPRISVVAITDEAMAKYGYPLPRGHYAKLIEKLNQLGVKTIIFDVLFVDPSPTDPESDRALIAATRKAGNVIHAMAIQPANVQGAVVNEKLMPIKGLAEAAFLTANVGVEPTLDRDGYIRRVMLFGRESDGFYDTDLGTGCKDCENMPVLSLSAAAYAHYTGTPVRQLYNTESKHLLRWLNFTSVKVLEESPGRKNKPRVEVYESLYPQVSIVDILDGTLSDEEKNLLKNGVAFVASTALGAAYDQYPSPFQPQTPGVMFHANSLDNLLNNNYLRVVDRKWPFLLMLLFIWLPALWFRASESLAAVLVFSILAFWSITFAFLYAGGIKAQYVMPSVGLLGSFVIATIMRVVIEGREKKWIKNTFGQYLSPKVVEVLVKDPDRLRLGGEKRDMTVLFLDIAHFTTISEKMDPEALTNFLNKYLSSLTDVILKNDGVVDKYIGDCIMAFWNAPLDVKRHRYMGCLSAIECQEAITKLNAELENFAMPEKPAIRVGVNAGFMVVGNMGSNTRFSYTVIGDEVNLASRMEGANKYFGSNIMISESIYNESKDDVEARPLGRVRVVGKNIPIAVYEPLAKKGSLTPEQSRLLSAYLEGCERFGKREFAAAVKSFSAALEAVPGDKPSQFYLKNAQNYVAAPPPQDWDGVFNLTSK
ncbi:MAG TPA: adenylate/guanylate cyclase domain-containing protein [Elusimicrobiales bacterium]|nr:adenylate/guanylate cyclase domain-containing protein [Elusimicrobiales bacterium]